MLDVTFWVREGAGRESEGGGNCCGGGMFLRLVFGVRLWVWGFMGVVRGEGGLEV